jgi:DNA-directed RNA polymerase subunit RPC12/RpoP
MGSQCSQCGSVVWWEGELRLGDRLTCPNCFVKLLVVRLDPVCLEFEETPPAGAGFEDGRSLPNRPVVDPSTTPPRRE